MRIANVSGLGQYYREIGAYGDITPDDGSTETFTPSQPPLDNNGWTERCVTGVGWGNGHTGKEKRAALCG